MPIHLSWVSTRTPETMSTPSSTPPTAHYASEPARALALILPGSGEIDRNADHRRMPLGISRDPAHALALKGIASFRYDKRGVGHSEGSPSAVDSGWQTDVL
jgi:alpha/beta superfamily hydrolase